MTTIYVIPAVLFILIIWGIASYNGFVMRRNRAKEALSDIDIQTKRRYDLIPNLVATVKGYAAHESSAFENVTRARAMAMGASGMADKAKAEDMLSGALKSLFAVAEAYPTLKANENFLGLQRELGDTEDKIQAARRFYNSTVQDFNTALQSFPGNIIAGQLGFTSMDLFALSPGDAAAEEPVKVSF
jgi:LemA protein